MKFAYWSREIGGWALILIGLIVLWNAFGLFLSKRILDGTPLMFLGFIVFRGGIHVLKVAVAAQAARSLHEPVQQTVRRTPRVTVQPIGPTQPKSVLPGHRASRTQIGDR